MIDFETELRDRLDRATADVAPSPDLLDVIERRITTVGRRTGALRVAGVLAVVALAAGVALAATGGDGGDDDAPTATDPTVSVEEGTTTTTAPLPSGWATMADAPIEPRTQHLVLAMDDEVLVLGGNPIDQPTAPPGVDQIPTFLADGAVYDAATDTWRTIPDSPLPGAASGVWTGTEAILVSGGPYLTSPTMDGGPPAAAAFDPVAGTWRALAAPPADLAPGSVSTVWTGTHVVALQTGTAFPEDPQTTAVGVYDPATDTWTSGAAPDDALGLVHGTAWTGDEVLVVADIDSDPATSVFDEAVVRAYDPAADTWRDLPWGLTPGSRVSMVVAWTGDRLFVAGGLTFAGQEEERAREAALLDPATDTWTPVGPAPTGVFGPDVGPALWAGDRVVSLAVASEGHPMAPLAPLGTLAFDPATGAWEEGPVRPGDQPVEADGAVWAAGRIVVPLGGTISTDDCCGPGIPGGATYVP